MKRLMGSKNGKVIKAFKAKGKRLSEAEAGELTVLETAWARTTNQFEKGAILDQIRAKELYRMSFTSFEQYCVERCSCHHSHAYRLMDAHEVLTVLSPLGDIPLPVKEKHIRVLVRCSPEVARDTWVLALKSSGSLTRMSERTVKEALRQVQGATARGIPEIRPETRELWQCQTIPSLENALAAVKRGDRWEAIECIGRAVNQVEIGLTAAEGKEGASGSSTDFSSTPGSQTVYG